MSLACGGRGPCCHVGYAHRHCEHCDVVIALSVQPHYHGYPWYGTYGVYNGSFGINPFAGQQQLNNNLFNQLASGLNVTEVPIDAGQQSSQT